MISANLFVMAWVMVALNAANGLHAAARGWKGLAVYSAFVVAYGLERLWHWTVTP